MLVVKTLHIWMVISWFAGLFYLPRIFVNLAMVPADSVAERDRVRARVANARSQQADARAGDAADLAEAATLEQPAARRVVGNAGRVDPVQAEARMIVIGGGEGKGQQHIECCTHQPKPGIGFAHPIAEIAALRREPSHIVEVDPTQQRVAGNVVAAGRKDVEGVALVVVPFAHDAVDATAIAAARKRVVAPDRLLGFEEPAATFAQG